MKNRLFSKIAIGLLSIAGTHRCAYKPSNQIIVDQSDLNFKPELPKKCTPNPTVVTTSNGGKLYFFTMQNIRSNPLIPFPYSHSNVLVQIPFGGEVEIIDDNVRGSTVNLPILYREMEEPLINQALFQPVNSLQLSLATSYYNDHELRAYFNEFIGLLPLGSSNIWYEVKYSKSSDRTGFIFSKNCVPISSSRESISQPR